MAFYCVDEEKNIFFPLFRIARAKKIAFSAIKTARKALYIMFLYMRLRRTRHIAPVLLLALVVLAAACSTQKNTAKSRAWHSFKAKYNAFYNGKLAYIALFNFLAVLINNFNLPAVARNTDCTDFVVVSNAKVNTTRSDTF